MKRTAVFAHYDKDNLIDDYVIYYLKALKKITEKIVFVSCCEINQEEKSKLDGIADFVIAEQHEEYDFGSYKRGFFYLKNFNILDDTDELIFANDSCFGPLYPLDKVFEKMKNENCDFWGITKNRFGIGKKNGKFSTVIRPHIQSYFLVFSKKVFTCDIFQEFISKIKPEKEKSDIVINYEIGLSELLESNDFKGEAYVKDYYKFNHVFLTLWRDLIKKSKCPTVKCSLFRLANRELATISGWQKFISENTDYPVLLIEKNIERTINLPLANDKFPGILKVLFFKYVIGMAYKNKIKSFIIKITRKYFSFLSD